MLTAEKNGNYKHGEWDGNKYSPEYKSLAGIIQRCTNPAEPSYVNYGARGIKVCEEWDSLLKFRSFLEYIGRRPSPMHSIERIQVDGHYEPGNVKWATKREQAQNRRDTVWLTYNGETLPLTAVAEKYSINQDVLRTRVGQHGWSIPKALTTPVATRGRYTPSTHSA